MKPTIKLPICLLTLLLAIVATRAQMPDLSEGKILWQDSEHHPELRLWQIPKRATALIPLRFFLQEVPTEEHEVTEPSEAVPACPDCAGVDATLAPKTGSPLESFDHAVIRVLEGKEARLSFEPRRYQLNHWGNRLVEVRETFKLPGTYEIDLVRDGENIRVPVKVAPYHYISFTREFLLFVAGSVVVGAVMLTIVFLLHRRERTMRSRAVPESAPDAS